MESENFTLSIANKIFLGVNFSPKETFLSQIREDFSSEVSEIDFAKSKKAATTINNWVAKETNNKIKRLVSPILFDKFTTMVLVNAIYFKANWAKKFDKKATKNKPFYTKGEHFFPRENPNHDLEHFLLPMMTITADFKVISF